MTAGSRRCCRRGGKTSAHTILAWTVRGELAARSGADNIDIRYLGCSQEILGIISGAAQHEMWLFSDVSTTAILLHCAVELQR